MGKILKKVDDLDRNKPISIDRYLSDNYDIWENACKAADAFTEKECHKKGFITNFGLTAPENDFDEYSAMIFTHPEKFTKIMVQYPRIRKKFLVRLQFFHKIDPEFTEEYLFR